jgi:hypothetical protein
MHKMVTAPLSPWQKGFRESKVVVPETHKIVLKRDYEK